MSNHSSSSPDGNEPENVGDSNADDECVDPRLANKIKKEYEEAQKSAESPQTHSFHRCSLRSGDRPKRLAASSRANDKKYWASFEASPTPSATEDATSKMPAHSVASSRNNIVEEYLSPNDGFQEDYQVFKGLRDAEKVEVIRREAEEHGMEKPLGYTVSFHYNPHVEYHHFGSSHPMKPWRLTLTKQLVIAYGLEYCMDLYEPRPASFDELTVFHDREYTQFLSQYAPRISVYFVT